MKLIELHILQSFPVSCLNRDDVGAPKTAVFGGVTRARISSQCLKRAIREFAQDNLPAARFGGQRTKLIIEPLKKALLEQKVPEAAAAKYALEIADLLSGLDDKTVDKEGKAKEGKIPRVGTLIFLSSAEIKALAADVAKLVKSDGKAKLDTKKLIKACQSAPLSDAADIAIFGRMVAKGPDLTLEGAAMFSHALSTHRADNDIDFFSAVDDAKLKEEDAGAGMIGTIEFTSAVYYRYAALNLGLLADKEHLCAMTKEERQQVVDAFIRAVVLAVPGARKNSMNANTDVDYVIGIVKDKGQPLQLVNAFEEARRSKNGLVPPSVKAELLRLDRIKSVFSPNHAVELATGMYEPKPDEELKGDMIPKQVSLDAFCKEIIAHVD
ncbi:MAG: type I-E CRISPR-associated protein Cas7/Cse4/CasC [Verrucomicrobia bacterium]|nr:type I-E CRISPR-associated protein Cas7/Cse4/CasC [Verrucomicrobiota bacterium]